MATLFTPGEHTRAHPVPGQRRWVGGCDTKTHTHTRARTDSGGGWEVVILTLSWGRKTATDTLLFLITLCMHTVTPSV